jgi:hypothetical protein
MYKPTKNVFVEPPIHVQVKSLYDRWCQQLRELDALRGSPGFDNRHNAVALEDLRELFTQAEVLKMKCRNKVLITYLDRILSRPVHDHMLFAQGKQNIISVGR